MTPKTTEAGVSVPTQPPPGDDEMDATMVQVVQALSETYRDPGVAIWLATTHKSGPLADMRPIELCRTAAGRAQVLAAAESLTGMVAS